MRLLIVRHGDPDYVHDSLTETGFKEANLLVPRMEKEEIKDIYVSPLGRAQRTAEPTLKALGRTAETLDWLQEFPAKLDINGNEQLQRMFPNTRKNPDGTFMTRNVWDIAPGEWRDDPRYYTRDGWRDSIIAENSDLNETYDWVCQGFDKLLEEHGYRRDGMLYRTEQGNNDTLVLFCHFGLTCVLLSHLMGVSPFVLWHGTTTAPTSVTEVFTEERQKGIVSWRAWKIGDVSHLYAAGEEPSFAARFCSVYENEDERH